MMPRGEPGLCQSALTGLLPANNGDSLFFLGMKPAYTQILNQTKHHNSNLHICPCSRLGRFLQAVVEERPSQAGDISIPNVGVFESSRDGRITPLYLKWEELTYSKVGIKVYEHSGAIPSPHSTFRLRYNVTNNCTHSKFKHLLFLLNLCFPLTSHHEDLKWILELQNMKV